MDVKDLTDVTVQCGSCLDPDSNKLITKETFFFPKYGIAIG